MKRKRKMHKTHYVNGSSAEKFLYKQYTNTLTRVKNLSKRVYCHCKIDELKNSPKKPGIFCVLYYQINQNHLSLTLVRLMDDTNISDPKIKAERFNTHFANVGKLLAASLIANDTDFPIYLLILLCIFIQHPQRKLSE